MAHPQSDVQSGIIRQQAELTSILGSKLSDERWAVYREVMRAVSRTGVRFAVGGGIAAMGYADQVRESKDLDLYILPEDRDALVGLLTGLGFTDYYDEKPYERHWIYRSVRDGFIVDAMWAMANRRAAVSREWLTGPEVTVDDFAIRLLPPEQTLWTKLYVLQRDRCDWPDALNILYVVGPSLDWARLLELVDSDAGLLAGLVATFCWLAPERSHYLPTWLWSRLGLRQPPEKQDSYGTAAVLPSRAALLDSRPWFTPLMNAEHRLGGESKHGEIKQC